MADDEFKDETKRVLRERVAGFCSNPKHRVQTLGPHEVEAKSTLIGETCHITAKEAGGPRHDPSLTSNQRKHISNGIWLCRNCHKLVDRNPLTYTSQLLRQWKEAAEAQAAATLGQQMDGALQHPNLHGLRPDFESSAAPVPLTLDQTELTVLVAAANSATGRILVGDGVCGPTVMVLGGALLTDGTDARIVAIHRSALARLMNQGLLRSTDHHIYHVTRRGFETAEELRSTQANPE